jgi:hypothetical protein
MQHLQPTVQPVPIAHREMLQARPEAQAEGQSKAGYLALSLATAVNPRVVAQHWAVLLVASVSPTREMISTDASTMTACVATNQKQITQEHLMSILKYHRSFNAITQALTLIILLGASGATLAAEDMKKEKVVAINEYTCERLITASSDDRAAAIAFLHGYKAGMAGKKTIDTEKLGIASDRLVVHCLDNRTDTAVAAYDKVLKTLKN